VKVKIKNRQFIATINLLNKLKEVNDKKLASISNIVTMVNFNLPNSILLRYEKDYFDGNDFTYEYKIAEIDENGNVKFIDEKFNNIFERYSFLGECKTFDFENPNDYEKVD